jgi:nucleotide-binding universal stress UspA family protein
MAVVPGERRIVVGVNGSAESVSALRWAGREADLRGAHLHVVLAHESDYHRLATYATRARVPQPRGAQLDPGSILRKSVDLALGQAPKLNISTELAAGLAARILLDRAADAEMLVLGHAFHGTVRRHATGPVIRACLLASPCPVVVIREAEVAGLVPGHSVAYADI